MATGKPLSLAPYSHESHLFLSWPLVTYQLHSQAALAGDAAVRLNVRGRVSVVSVAGISLPSKNEFAVRGSSSWEIFSVSLKFLSYLTKFRQCCVSVEYKSIVNYQNKKFVEQYFMNIINNSFLFYAFKIKIVTVNPIKKEKVDILVAFFSTMNNATVKFLITCFYCLQRVLLG